VTVTVLSRGLVASTVARSLGKGMLNTVTVSNGHTYNMEANSDEHMAAHSEYMARNCELRGVSDDLYKYRRTI
jgi:hypothetical protein